MYGDLLLKRQILNRSIFLQWQFGAQLPNLIPATISGYMVIHYGQVVLWLLYDTVGLFFSSQWL